MGIKQIKPTNTASRQQTRSDFAELTAERLPGDAARPTD